MAHEKHARSFQERSSSKGAQTCSKITCIDQGTTFAGALRCSTIYISQVKRIEMVFEKLFSQIIVVLVTYILSELGFAFRNLFTISLYRRFN